MPLSPKEQPRCLIIMGVDIRKCQFAPKTACSGHVGTVQLFWHFSGFEFFSAPKQSPRPPSRRATGRGRMTSEFQLAGTGDHTHDK